MNRKANAAAYIAVIVAFVALGSVIIVYSSLSSSIQETSEQIENLDIITTQQLLQQADKMQQQEQGLQEATSQLSNLGMNCSIYVHEPGVTGDEACSWTDNKQCIITRSPSSNTYFESRDGTCSGETIIHYQNELTYRCDRSVHEATQGRIDQQVIEINGQKRAVCNQGGRFSRDHYITQAGTQSLCCTIAAE